MVYDTKSLHVKFPEDILKGNTIEDVIINSVDMRLGVAVLSGKLENRYLLRLYQIVRQNDWDDFFPTHEIGAFTFHNRKGLMDVVDRLPGMSAIEILMMMNPLPNH